MTDFNLSVSDLLLIDGFKEAYGKEDNRTVRKILFMNGLNIKEPYEVVVTTHRNLRNQVVTCERYEGSERLDTAWLKSGFASMYAIIEATKDDNLRHTLRVMSADRTQDKVFD